MENEKVKEIKDSIQRKINRAEKVGDDLVNCVSIDALKMYLTLINELESENKELRVVVDIANERTYRKKFTDECRKEYQDAFEMFDKDKDGAITARSSAI